MKNPKFKMFKQICSIPANTGANTPFPVIFKHPDNKQYGVIGLGLVELANPNNKNYNFALEAQKDTTTLDSISKKFYEATNQCPLNDRFLPIEFDIPQDQESRIILTPTEAVGNANIDVQVVFKYLVKE